MKKLFLLFTILALGFSLSSCLEGGSQNFSEVSVVYISSHEGKTFGKTLTGRLITSDKMKLEMEPGTFKLFAYSWDESYGMEPIGSASAYNVLIGGDVVDVRRTTLNMSPVGSQTPPVHFKNIKTPVYDENGAYLDDYWLFEYVYTSKEGQTPLVSFHKRATTEGAGDNIEIDVRLSKSGTPKEGATDKLFSDLIAVNMKPLRDQYLSTSSSKSITVKFYYYLEGSNELSSSQSTYRMVAKDK